MDDQFPPPVFAPLDGQLDVPLRAPLSAPYLAPFAPEPTDVEDAEIAPSAGGSLADSAVYRPGVAVALLLLAGPLISAVAGATIAFAAGSLPIWLPFTLLLWLPVQALVWVLLSSVRVTPTSIASGRPLGRWRVLSFADVERVERRGMRLILGGRSGPPMVFRPALLQGGDTLRRSILLRLPLETMWGGLRAEAQELTMGQSDMVGDSGVSDVLTVRTRWVWTVWLAISALVALGGALAALNLTFLPPQPLAKTPGLTVAAVCGGVTLLATFAALWMKQEIFFSEKGLIIRYSLLRRERVVFWTQVSRIEYTPADLALRFKGARQVFCAGPGALAAPQARLARQYISRACLAPVVPFGVFRSR